MNKFWSKKSIFLIGSTLLMGLLFLSTFFVQNSITLEVDGEYKEIKWFFARDVADVLSQQEINLGELDKVEPALDSKLKKGMHIEVFRAFPVSIIADGEIREIKTTAIEISEAIRLAGFDLGEKDIVKTIPTPYTTPQQEIEVIRVAQEELQIEEEIPFIVERVPDTTLEKGISKTLSTGSNGLAKNTVIVTYHNGEEAKRVVSNSEVIKEPQNRVVSMGTITSVSRGTQRINFREAKYMEATAYTHTGNRTASGVYPQVGMVAVDTRLIPMGTQLYIEGYGFAHAADTGGAIKGDKIDLFMESKSQCLSFGRRTVKVYILD